VQGQEIVAPPEESPKAQVIDLMEALKASLGSPPARPGKKAEADERKPPRRASAKKAKKAPKRAKK
jgi:non-homologous end joining protein Ku